MERRDLERHISVIGEVRERGNVGPAIEEYMKLLPDAKQLLYSQVPQMIGVSYRMMNRPNEALPFAQKAVRWAQEADDTEQEANCRRDLSRVYSQLEEYHEAKQELQRSLEILWDMNESAINGLAGTFSAMAKLHATEGELDEAIILGERAFFMTEASVKLNPENAGQHYLFAIHLAEIYYQANMHDKALIFAEHARDGATKLGQKVRADRAQKLIEELQRHNSS